MDTKEIRDMSITLWAVVVLGLLMVLIALFG